jgi:hypothetical protein
VGVNEFLLDQEYDTSRDFEHNRVPSFEVPEKQPILKVICPSVQYEDGFEEET